MSSACSPRSTARKAFRCASSPPKAFSIMNGVHARSLRPELMDDPSLPPAQLFAAVRGLDRLNAISLADLWIWRAIRTRVKPGASLRLLDVATGSGNVALGVVRRARRAGVSVHLGVCDVREEMLSIAAANARKAGVQIEAFSFDARRDGLPGGFDIAINSLFCHHLPEEDVARLLREMGRAARLVVISDLSRSRLNLALAFAASRLGSRSHVVHEDAVLSVRAAFTPKELQQLAVSAGLSDIRLHAGGPARFILTAAGAGHVE